MSYNQLEGGLVIKQLHIEGKSQNKKVHITRTEEILHSKSNYLQG